MNSKNTISASVLIIALIFIPAAVNATTDELQVREWVLPTLSPRAQEFTLSEFILSEVEGIEGRELSLMYFLA